MIKKYTFISKIIWWFKSLFLWFFSLLIPKKKQLYIFWWNWWNTYSWNSKALFLFYLNKASNYQVYYIIKSQIDNIPLNWKNHFIKKWTLKYFYLYLRAELIFIDWTLWDIWPLSLIIWNFNVINLWHWDPIKKIWFSNLLHFKKISNF